MDKLAKIIYLDHAAATALDEDVYKAMQPFYRDLFYNPSANYALGQKTKQALESARFTIAQIIGAKASEITFTGGGSEANNLAIHGLMTRFPDSNIIVSTIEHDSVLKPAADYKLKQCPVDKGGLVNLEALATLIDDQTVLVSIMYANNEIGTVEPISQIARLVALVRTRRLKKGLKLPLYLHSDACQAANYLDLHVSRLGVDLMTLNAGKIYGPKQTGLLFVKAGVNLKPLIQGGGQEHGLRSGTESVAGAAGLAAALEKSQSSRKDEAQRLELLRDGLANGLTKIRQDIIFNGDKKHKLANNLHFSLPGEDNERILFKLDQAGILAAAGSACSASSDQPSHVLAAIGLNDDLARSSIRISLGRSTTTDDIDRVLEVMQTILE